MWQPGDKQGHQLLSVATTRHHYNTTTMQLRPPHCNAPTTTMLQHDNNNGTTNTMTSVHLDGIQGAMSVMWHPNNK
jgi:hypothetical protein